MSDESVVGFCAVVTADKELQAQLRSTSISGDGVPRFVTLSAVSMGSR